MKLNEAHNLILKIESIKKFRKLEWNEFILWPLIRRCLWVLLTSPPPEKKSANIKWLETLKTIVKFIYSYFIIKTKLKLRIEPTTTDLIFSRPVYLKKMFDGSYFDVIADPIMHVCLGKKKIQKIYFGSSKKSKKTAFKSKYIFLASEKKVGLPTDLVSKLEEISEYANLDKNKFFTEFQVSLNLFLKSYKWMNDLLERHENLNRIFVVGWYNPVAMGLIAASRGKSKTAVDLQHGKQGKYQSMYSGWNYITKDNDYLMLPDYFWTWGEKSKSNILNSSLTRKTHLPFVGGFPWIDYYQKKILPNLKIRKKNSRLTILVTLQNREGVNIEPIPNFLFEFLEEQQESVYFLFRCHPNDKNGQAYCKKRLKSIDIKSYEIISGVSDLYENFLESDLHVTAYSTCCYEANLFGVRTLLFGEDSKEIYSDEIKEGEFDWIEDDKEKFKLWINNHSILKHKNIVKLIPSSYIKSSLFLASEIMNEDKKLASID